VVAVKAVQTKAVKVEKTKAYVQAPVKPAVKPVEKK